MTAPPEAVLTKSVARIPAVLLLTLCLAASAAAEPITLLIGTLSFDQFIPGDQSAPGTNAFNIVNYTGTNAILDPNASTELIFSALVLSLVQVDGEGGNETEIIDIGSSLGPGTLLDPITQAPLFALQRPDTTFFASATLQGTVSLVSFFLPDGRLFVADSPSFSTLLLPSAGAVLNPFDIVGIEISGNATVIQSVPEPSSLLTLLCGLALICRARQVRRSIEK